MTDITTLPSQTSVIGTTSVITSEAKLLSYDTLKAQVVTDLISDSLVAPSTSKSLSQVGTQSLLAAKLSSSNNLSDVGSVLTSRANLGLEGNRNGVMNGDFTVLQRGGPFVSPPTGAYIADRWFYSKGGTMNYTIGTTTATPTVAQAGRFFQSALQMQCTTADTSIGASEGVGIEQRLEGYIWARFAQIPLTCSFWVKATKAGIYCFYIKGANVSYVAEYTINASNTWEYKTIAISASPSAGSWDYYSGIGVGLGWSIAAGTSVQTTPGSWNVGNFTATANQVNGCDTINNYFYITGVQLEAGTIATPFYGLAFADELMRCKRYFQFCSTCTTYVNTVNATTGRLSFYLNYQVAMRTGPTVAQTGLFNAQNGSASVNQISINLINSYMGTKSGLIISGNYNTSAWGVNTIVNSPLPENNSQEWTLSAEM